MASTMFDGMTWKATSIWRNSSWRRGEAEAR
jgi:hypothetical protein